MDIYEIIQEAPTTSLPWTGELTNGTTQAILTFASVKAADEVAAKLRQAGAEIVAVTSSAYGEGILVASWTE